MTAKEELIDWALSIPDEEAEKWKIKFERKPISTGMEPQAPLKIKRRGLPTWETCRKRFEKY